MPRRPSSLCKHNTVKVLPIRAWLKVAHFQCVKVRQMVPVVVTVRPQRPSLSLSVLFFFYTINGAGGRSQTPSDKQQVSEEALDLSAGRLVNFSFFLLSSSVAIYPPLSDTDYSSYSLFQMCFGHPCKLNRIISLTCTRLNTFMSCYIK